MIIHYNNIRVFIIGITMFLSMCFYANQQGNDTVRVEMEYEVFNVFGINTKYSEFSPVWYNTELIFSSDREWNNNLLGESNWDHIKHINLFKVKVKSYVNDSIVFLKPKIYNRQLISDDHVGPICFNRDGTEAIFSELFRTGNKKEVKNNAQLFSVQINEKKLQGKRKLDFNDVNYSYSHPTYSSDGNRIYFVSNLPCNKTGKNIFFSDRIADGWSKPQLVDSVNSDGDDMFPTIVGTKMYFSSNGFDSHGGLDLFESELIDGKWNTPINLGPSINTIADEFSMVFNPNGKSGYFTSNRENGKGADDIYYFNLITKAIVSTKHNQIKGQFEYYNLKGNPDNMDVMLIDDEGNIVATTNTDKDGNFSFDYLPIDKTYTIKINDEDEVVLTIYKDGGNALLVANKNGEFVFRKLSYDGSGVMSLIDEADVDLNTGLYDFQGQFEYQQLEGHYPDNMKVYLVDEEGNVVMETTTDAYGNFKFEKLSTDNNFIVKVDDNSDLVLKVFNKVDHLLATMTKDNKGEFVFRLLEADYSSNIELLSEDEMNLEFSSERMLVSGYFQNENLKDINDKLAFEVLDYEGDLLLNAETDSNGYFRLDNLPLLDELLFKLNENSPYFNIDIKLNMTSRSNEVLVVLDKDEFGIFFFKRMVASKYNIIDVEDLDTTEILETTSKLHIENFVVYYPNNGFKISNLFMSTLDSMVIALNENKNAILQIQSHASATATETYNMNLSLKRMNKLVDFFIEHDIAPERLSYNAFGESKLVNMCGDDVNCNEEMHKLNRRSELKIIVQD